MEIERIIEEKKRIESEILDFIREKCNEFEELTTLYPKDVYAHTITPEIIGEPKSRCEIVGFDLIVEV